MYHMSFDIVITFQWIISQQNMGVFKFGTVAVFVGFTDPTYKIQTDDRFPHPEPRI